jgi:hypothetical protein
MLVLFVCLQHIIKSMLRLIIWVFLVLQHYAVPTRWLLHVSSIRKLSRPFGARGLCWCWEWRSHADVENEEVREFSPMSSMTSKSKMKGRSKDFSEDEDNLLVSTWLNIGQDPVDGNQQKNTTFWGRVETYFHEHMTFESDRNWSLLKHIWGTIKKEVSLFCGFHESVERRNESDKTSNDKVNG